MTAKEKLATEKFIKDWYDGVDINKMLKEYLDIVWAQENGFISFHLRQKEELRIIIYEDKHPEVTRLA